MLGTARGDRVQVEALHGSRVESFLGQAIDSTMRGFVYEAAGPTVGEGIRVEAERIVRTVAERNAIPVAILRADIADPEIWQAEAQATVEMLLGRREDRGGALSLN
jgi:hypothetical protein